MTNKEVKIIYSEDKFTEFEMKILSEYFYSNDLYVEVKEKNEFVNASIDFFVPDLEVIFPAVLEGVLVSGASSLIKESILYIYKTVRSYLKKENKKGNAENLNIHFKINDCVFVIPQDIEMSKYTYAVDSFFKAACARHYIEEQYMYYSESEDEFVLKSQSQIINEKCKEEQYSNE